MMRQSFESFLKQKWLNMLLSKKNILFYFFLFFWVSFSFSQKSTHNINVKIYQEDYESKIDVEKRAKEQLKKEALNKAGVLEDISIITSQFKIEDNDGFSEVFNSDMFSSMNGGVTNIKNQKDEWGFDKNLEKPYYKLRAKVTVEKYKLERDPKFKAKVRSLDRFGEEEKSFKDKERLNLEILPYEDTYLRIFLMSENQNSLIFPYSNDTDPQLVKDEVFIYDDVIFEKTQDFREDMLLIVVMTKEKIPFESVFQDDQGYQTKTKREDILKWIFSIPQDQRNEYRLRISLQ